MQLAPSFPLQDRRAAPANRIKLHPNRPNGSRRHQSRSLPTATAAVGQQSGRMRPKSHRRCRERSLGRPPGHGSAEAQHIQIKRRNDKKGRDVFSFISFRLINPSLSTEMGESRLKMALLYTRSLQLGGILYSVVGVYSVSTRDMLQSGRTSEGLKNSQHSKRCLHAADESSEDRLPPVQVTLFLSTGKAT